MKKKMSLLLSFVSLLLGASVYLLCLAPAVVLKGESALIGASTETTSSFYDLLGVENTPALNIALIIVLSVGVALALCLFLALLLVKMKKKNKSMFACLSVLVFLVFVAAGVMFFFVANAYKGSQLDLGSLGKISVNLGIGAICSGILSILGGLVALFNTTKLAK